MNVVNRVVLKNKVSTAPSRLLKPVDVPFSITGIIGVLACPVLLCTDLLTPGYTFLGVIYVIMLALLGNERRTLIALFTTIAAVTLVFDVICIYGQSGSELAVMDKFLALLVLPLLGYALIRQRGLQAKRRRRKRICNMTIIPPVAERIALNGETKSVFRHICRSKGPLDEYTRELIWFVYMKSPKN